MQNWQFLHMGDLCQPNCSFEVPFFWIQNQGTGKCMDLNNGSSVNGTRSSNGNASRTTT